MKVKKFMKDYGGNACISIDGYCEEEYYDYIRKPDNEDLPDLDGFTCLALEPWWDEVKDRKIKHWNIIGGGSERVELTICLK